MKQAKQRKFRIRLTKIDVNFTVVDLSSVMHMPITPAFNMYATDPLGNLGVDIYCLEDATGERVYLGKLEVQLSYTGDPFTVLLKEINHETNQTEVQQAYVAMPIKNC